MELLLWRATSTGWKVRRKQSQPFLGADTFLWKTPAFSLSPSVLLYMNKWFWITDNQGPRHPELLGSVDIWNYLQIWAFLWKEDKSFIQLSAVSVVPWSLNRHQSYGLCWSGQAPQGHNWHSRVSIILSTSACLVLPPFTTRVCFHPGCAYLSHSPNISDPQTCS